METVIRVESLVQHYGLKPILKNVSFEVFRGECVAIVGENASGKTTLLDTLGGLFGFESGRVEIFGKGRRATVGEERFIRRRTCYLPIEPIVSPYSTVREHWLATAQLWGRTGSKVFPELDALAQAFDLIESLDSPIKSLSSGQCKKVQLGGALLTNTELLILDEPFSGGLDPAGIRALQRILQRLAESDDRTVVFSTPVPELIESIADRVIVLRHGEIAEVGTPAELIAAADGATTLTEALVKLSHWEANDGVDRYLDAIGGQQ